MTVSSSTTRRARPCRGLCDEAAVRVQGMEKDSITSLKGPAAEPLVTGELTMMNTALSSTHVNPSRPCAVGDDPHGGSHMHPASFWYEHVHPHDATTQCP